MYNFLQIKFKILLILTVILGLNSNSYSQDIFGDISGAAYYNFDTERLSVEWQYITEKDNFADSYEIYVSYEIENRMEFDFENAELIAEISSEEAHQKIFEEKIDGEDISIVNSIFSTVFNTNTEMFNIGIRFLIENEVYESNAIPVRFKEEYYKQVRFTNFPETIANIGVEYSFDFDATTGDENDEINFEIVKENNASGFLVPENYEFNEETGEFTWMPQEAGLYYLGIKAFLVDDPYNSVMNYFQIEVVSCGEETLLNLMIKDQDGDGPEGFVELVYVGEKGGRYGSGSFWSETEDGNVSMRVREGDFKILFFPYEDEMEGIENWYNGAFSFEDADIVSMECGDNLTLQMDVRTDISWEDRYNIVFEDENKNLTAQVNSLFEYDVNASYKPEPNKAIEYSIIGAYSQNGESLEIEIDSETGIISWTPEELGHYSFTVRASLADDKAIFSDKHYQIKVMECEIPGKLTVNIVDEDGKRIKWGTGFVIDGPLDSASNVGFTKFQYFEIADGRFKAELDKGEYYIGVQTEESELTYYESSTDLYDATPVSIDCEKEMEITIVVKEYVREYVTISGFTSDANGTPIQAEIIFEGKSYNNGSNRIDYETWATTSFEGEYSIELPTNFEFTAYAIPIDSMGIIQPIPLWFNQTYNPEKAEIIFTNQDFDFINFVFEEFEEENLVTIKGSVMSEEDIFINNTMIVALDRGNTATGGGFGMTAYSEDGNFEMNLPEGDYYFFAIPDSRDYAPGFYVEGDVASFIWDEATLVELNADLDIDWNIDIVLEAMADIGSGIGSVSGSIVDATNNTSISNADILLEQNGQPVMFGNSASNGNFGMSSLPSGNYRVTVNKMGYERFTSILNLDETQPINLEIPLQPASTLSVDSFEGLDLTVGPNPAIDNITLSLEKNVQNAKVSILSVSGNLLYEESFSGLEHTIDLNEYSVGVYIISYESENGSGSYPFVISK